MGEFYLLKHSKGTIALSTGFGIGAPVVAGLTDEFVSLGVRQFALIGMAGGLQPDLKTGSLVVSTGAIRGEGVSRHYLPPAEIVNSSDEMVRDISAVLKKLNKTHFPGLTWTTDSPFRELRKDVLAYQKRGILTVDMEAAGMLAVAEANGLPAVAVFSVADTLADGIWNMSTEMKIAQQGLNILFDSVYSCFLRDN
jgi:uridine phosphorylase